MTSKELQQIYERIWALLHQQVANNPYFIFIYDWGIVNQTSCEVPTASQIMQCVNAVQFPPIGKN